MSKITITIDGVRYDAVKVVSGKAHCRSCDLENVCDRITAETLCSVLQVEDNSIFKAYE